MLLGFLAIFGLQSFAIGIDYVTVAQDEVCGNDGEINFQITGLAYGQDFEVSLDGGSSWTTFTHDVMYSGGGYSIYFLSAADYNFVVREVGDAFGVQYTGNPVVLAYSPLPVPELVGYYTGHGNTCVDNGSIGIIGVNATYYSIDNGATWQTSDVFSVPNGVYYEDDLMVKNDCGVTAHYFRDETFSVVSFQQIDIEDATVGYGLEVDVDGDDPTCATCSDGMLWLNSYPQDFVGLEWSINGNAFESVDDYQQNIPPGVYQITFKDETCEYLHPDEVFVGGSFVVNIPDPMLKAQLVANTSINTNADAEIQYSEAWSFAGNIEVQSSNISDLTGLEAFIHLKELNCQSNNITVLNVSANTELTNLNCSGNSIGTLDLSANSDLYDLNAGSCGLIDIDLSQNLALVFLTLSDNALESLDLSLNASLDDVYLSDNSLLELTFGGNTPGYVDLANNQNLVCVQVGDPDFADNNWDFDSGVSFTSSVCLSSNAFLSDISISGTTIDNFAFDTYDYTINYPYCQSYDDNVTATLDDATANLNIELPGVSNNHVCTITVTAENGTTEHVYTVNFVASDEIVINSVTANHPTCPDYYGGFTVDATGGNGNLETGVFTNTGSGVWSWWYDGSYPIDNIGASNYVIRVRDEDGCEEVYNGGDSIAIEEPEYTQEIGGYNNISAVGADDGSFIANVTFEGASSYMYQLLVWDELYSTWDNLGVEQSSNEFENLAPGKYSYSFRALPMGCDIYTSPSTNVYVIISEPDLYTVTINVTDGTDPIDGASVTLDGTELTTDASGSVTFTDLMDGNYSYYVSADGYSSYPGNVTVNGADETVDVTLDLIPIHYSVTFNVTDGTNPVEGASVTFGAATLLTDASGVLVIDDQPAAEYDWSVSATGFVTQSGTVTVSDQDVTIDVTLVAETQFYNVTFYVSDGTNPIEGATVTIGTYDFVTLANGYVTSNALAAATFDYTVTADGYQTVQDQFTIVDQDITVNVELELVPAEVYDVTFNVTDGTDAIEGASITFDGTDYTTDAAGQLVISDLEAGTYNYTVTATDYQTYESQIEVIDQDVVENVEMMLVGLSQNSMVDISVYPNPAKSSLTLNGVSSDAIVNMYDITGTRIMTKEISGVGEFDVSHLASGIYMLEVRCGETIEIIKFQKM